MEEEWYIDATNASKARFKHIETNHEREYDSCYNNLYKIKNLFENGVTLKDLQNSPSFFRSEKQKLFRIGESGIKSAKAVRLYVYPCEKTKTIYVLGIGTKETQQKDIAAARKLIKRL